MKQKIKFFEAMSMFSAAAMFLLSFSKTKNIDTKDIVGAWGFGPAEDRTVMINTEKIFSVATYGIPGKKFISSKGGTWRVEGNNLVKKIEWNSKDSTQVGKEITEDVLIKDGKLFVKQTNLTWNRLDDGKPGELMGPWIITGSFRNDTVSKRSSPFFP